MTPQIKRPGTRLQKKTLAEFERKHGFLLPTTYRAFLLQHNGGIPEPSSYCRKRSKKPSEVCRYFFGLQSGLSYAEMEDALETYLGEGETRIPRRLLPIAEDPFGNLICLSLRGEDAGKVYFWDHEEETDQKRRKTGDVNDAAISLIADSFDAFLTQFAEDEDDQKAKQTRRSWRELIASGDRTGVEAWLDAGGDMNEQDSSDFHTPVSLAVTEEQQDIIDLLLDRGLEAAQALEAAANGANWLIVKRILERSKRKLVKMEPWIFQMALDDCDEVSVIEALLDVGAPLNATFQRGNALFHATERVADPAIINLLLKRGAEPGVPGSMSVLPLSNAICCGKFETAKLLMDAGENLYFQPHDTNLWGQTYCGPLIHLNNPSKRIRVIKSAVLEYAKSLGQTADNDAPRAKLKP